MKDKKGNDILIGHRCVIDDHILGIVSAMKELPVIMMLKENKAFCYEEKVSPDRIMMITK